LELDLHTNQQVLQTLTKNLSEPFFVKDRYGHLLMANQATIEAIGIPKSKIIGLSDYHFLSKNDQADSISENDRLVIETGKSAQFEEEITNHDGQKRIFLGTKAPLFNKDGEVYGLVGSFKDITAQKEMDRKQKELIKKEQNTSAELIELNELKDTFLSVISHELRTPLTSILGWAEIIQINISDTDQLRTGLKQIENEANKQAAKITELLDMSQIMAGKIKLHPGWFDPQKVLEQVVEASYNDAFLKKITFNTDYGYKTPIMYADEDRLKQALSYLLNNAIKFSNAEDEIAISLKEEGNNINFLIEDEGVGIEKHRLKTIFEPFAKSGAALKNLSNGLGLGLSLANKFATISGGNLTLDSLGTGSGTSAKLSIPVRSTIYADIPEAIINRDSEENVNEVPKKTYSLTNRKILLVDDDASTLYALKNQLITAGAEVDQATEGATALELSTVNYYDLIISDLAMPVMDGTVFIQKLRDWEKDNERPNTPALALSALASKKHIERCLDMGFNLNLIKPISMHLLVKSCYKLIKRYSE
jgi:PAS domain S-box-containing protein